MKKSIIVLLAIATLLLSVIPVVAAETGTITIKETIKDQEYSVYKMADLESYNQQKEAYLYTPVAAWKGFFEAYPTYFTINEQGYIILNTEATIDAAKLAKDALNYAETNSISATTDGKTATADNQELVFDNLELGYYLVDSSLGAFCGLTTTAPSAEVVEKNAKPQVNKQVEEDSNTNHGSENDADLFQTINYRSVVTVQKGAENYVLHDKMEIGLTYLNILSVTVDENDVAAANYSVATDEDDDCTFTISFADDYLATLAEGTEIVILYTAKLNEKATVGGEGNKNETWLTYGDNNSTAHLITTTYTYSFDLVKTDTNKQLLNGAEFKLYPDATSNECFWFLYDAAGYYVVPAGTENAVDTLVVANGFISIRGLDSDDYYLEETVAPTGYNKLTSRSDFSIDHECLSAIFDPSNGNIYVRGGVNIVNKTGALFPETGSLGTVFFFIIGGALVLISGVLLVIKKKIADAQSL